MLREKSHVWSTCTKRQYAYNIPVLYQSTSGAHTNLPVLYIYIYIYIYIQHRGKADHTLAHVQHMTILIGFIIHTKY